MKKISINLSKSYDCLLGEKLLEKTGELIGNILSPLKVMIVSDDTVFSLYGQKVADSVKKQGFAAETFVFKNGEKHKNIKTVNKLINRMLKENMTRDDAIIALGGGVVGDLAGFAAAIYRRGISFVYIPTTLLAAVDASVGGKTGVNLKKAKNQIGAFWQPSLVICDINTLKTLNEEQYSCGCAEVIKCAAIKDSSLFCKIEKTPIKEIYEEVIEACVNIKGEIVRNDEFDKGARMILNFGHTFGHAAEADSKYTLPHGRAVAMGMARATEISAEKGICSNETYKRLTDLLEKYNLPTRFDCKGKRIKEALLFDKKNRGEYINLIVLEEIGRCRTEKIGIEEIDGLIL